MAALWKRLVDDLLDRGATPRASKHGWLDVFTVAVPAALGSIAPILTPVRELLKDYPVADLLVRSLVPAVLAIVCAYCVFARETVIANRPAGFQAEAPPPHAGYRFTRAWRTTSKVAFVPLAVLAVLALLRIGPGPSGEEMGAGYLCKLGSGKPVSGGEVQAVDAAGRTVAQSPIDQTGFFYLEQIPSGLRLSGLRLTSSLCKSSSVIPWEDGKDKADGCPQDLEGQANRERHDGPWPVWHIHCD
jgi:hypothetical protein